MTDISAVVTCHGEGLLLGPSIASLQQAVDHARAAGLSVEVLAVIDRGDAITAQVLRANRHLFAKVVESDHGDPGATRNTAVKESGGRNVAFLDGDDLWSFNWLTEAHRFAQAEAGPLVCHSEVNFVFGTVKAIWWHADSTLADFDPDYMLIGNYWDAMCYADRDLLLRYPFRANQLRDGYGHEDWLWNCTTLADGVHHRPVPGTVHFKRRRKGSQMAKCDDNDVVVFDNKINLFDPATVPA